jgi:hypothetical protein
MEIHLPKFEETVKSFVDTMDMTLTSRERAWILGQYTTDTYHTRMGPPSPLNRDQYDQLKKLYILWTYKEAFTKSKGLGLSFDFQKIDIDREVGKLTFKVSREPVLGLAFTEIILPAGQDSNRRSGAGTGMESLLVVVQNKQDDSTSTRTLNAEQAQKEKLLRLWTMGELVEASKIKNSNTTS